MRLPDFEAWAIFAKVAERGSFVRAAEELRLSNPTVSKAINRLEQSLGIALFSRNSRQMSLTDSGRRLILHAQNILAEAEAAENEARNEARTPSGLIRMAAPMTFGIQHLAPVLPLFLKKYPDISVSVDFSDTFIDLVAQGYDVALRIASLEDSSLRARRLCNIRLLLVAAPSYLEQTGRPHHPEALKTLQSLVYENGDFTKKIHLQNKTTGEVYSFSQTSRFRTNNGEAFLPALESGIGYGLFPEFIVWEGLRSGRLEQLLPAWEAKEIPLNLVTSSTTLRPARITALLEFLTDAFSPAPWTVVAR